MDRVIFFDLGNTFITATDLKQWCPGAKKALFSLSNAGARLGLISNTGAMKLGEVKTQLPADFPWQLFVSSLIVLSAETPWVKPQLEIFQEAIAKAEVTRDKCLYCSEDLAETLAAQCAGMHAARITPGDLTTFLTVLNAVDCSKPKVE